MKNFEENQPGWKATSKLSKDQKEKLRKEIADLFDAGWTLKQLNDKYKISKSSAYRLKKNKGQIQSKFFYRKQQHQSIYKFIERGPKFTLDEKTKKEYVEEFLIMNPGNKFKKIDFINFLKNKHVQKGVQKKSTQFYYPEYKRCLVHYENFQNEKILQNYNNQAIFAESNQIQTNFMPISQGQYSNKQNLTFTPEQEESSPCLSPISMNSFDYKKFDSQIQIIDQSLFLNSKEFTVSNQDVSTSNPKSQQITNSSNAYTNSPTSNPKPSTSNPKPSTSNPNPSKINSKSSTNNPNSQISNSITYGTNNNCVITQTHPQIQHNSYGSEIIDSQISQIQEFDYLPSIFHTGQDSQEQNNFQFYQFERNIYESSSIFNIQFPLEVEQQLDSYISFKSSKNDKQEMEIEE